MPNGTAGFPLFLIGDADGFPADLVAAITQLRRPVYEVMLPGTKQLSELRSISSLATMLCAAVKASLWVQS
jgi:hypothetical protein